MQQKQTFLMTKEKYSKGHFLKVALNMSNKEFPEKINDFLTKSVLDHVVFVS